MQFTNAIGVAAETERQDCHAERIVWIESCVAEREQLIEWNV